jgi:hypothetical protein
MEYGYSSVPFLIQFPYFEKKIEVGLRRYFALCVPVRVSPLIVARQRLGKHVPSATNTHATVKKIVRWVFFPLSSSYKRKVRD